MIDLTREKTVNPIVNWNVEEVDFRVTGFFAILYVWNHSNNVISYENYFSYSVIVRTNQTSFNGCNTVLVGREWSG